MHSVRQIKNLVFQRKSSTEGEAQEYRTIRNIDLVLDILEISNVPRTSLEVACATWNTWEDIRDSMIFILGNLHQIPEAFQVGVPVLIDLLNVVGSIIEQENGDPEGFSSKIVIETFKEGLFRPNPSSSEISELSKIWGDGKPRRIEDDMSLPLLEISPTGALIEVENTAPINATPQELEEAVKQPKWFTRVVAEEPGTEIQDLLSECQNPGHFKVLGTRFASCFCNSCLNPGCSRSNPNKKVEQVQLALPLEIDPTV